MKPIQQHTDEKLMELLSGGNQEAFPVLYDRYSQRLLYFMFKMLGQDEAKAQDFLQDVFLKIIQSPEKFDTKKVFKTWVFTVAANLCKNEFRKKNYEMQPISDVDLTTDVNISYEIDHQLFKKELAVELNNLPAVYKEVFILRYHENLALNEIAEVADCPLGTVKSRLHSATRLLSKKLKHYQPY